MKPSMLGVWGAAIAALAALGSPAQAAWNNVFQVCCNTCSTPAPVVASYGDACCAPACPPPPVCTTRYVQRTYYEPVVTYKPQTYTEAVTTYQTRYYTESCTSYRYSCAYNPCTCRYESVAQPVTSYRVRAKCCPVTSYLQRTCMVPVYSQRAVTMMEPVTSCCTTSTGPAVAAPPVAAPPAGTPAPGGVESREPAGALPPSPPGTETREPGAEGSPRYTPTPAMPPSSESGYRRPPALSPRFDRTASREDGTVEGRMTDAGRVPLNRSRVLFVSVEEKSLQFQTTTDADGVFRTKLARGGWLVYTFDSRGKPVFARRIDVSATKGVNFTLVSRN